MVEKDIWAFLKKLQRRQRLYAVLKFIVKFNLLAVPLYIILLLNFEFVELQLVTAQIVESMLHATGVQAVRDGIMISVPVENGWWGARIVWDCIGWKSILFFLALVFATDFPMKKKKWSLLFVPAISIVNIVRIWFMFYYVHAFGLAGYDVLHAVVWSFGLLAAVLVFWLVWLRFALKRP